MKEKSLKDAIHGYIKLEEPFWRIVDTVEFQRLKWIEQTSYRVLYPSARHDRFIHSVGVYHLGTRAISGFLQNSSPDDQELINKYKNSFLMACILHDIGHAPFSHTCEDLYNYRQKASDLSAELNKELLEQMELCLSKDEYDSFYSDYKYILSPKGKTPSEHEIMSSIVSIRNFSKFSSFFPEEEKLNLSLDLIIRAIVGCCYASKPTDKEETNREKGIKNCLIRLLNSSTVDVDKLDYIARDTQMSGYDNIVLDTERLLGSICTTCDDNVYYPAFKKSALSVINNVVVAKNSQAKWIVNHPVVIYESYLLRRAVGETLKLMAESIKEPKTSCDDLIKTIFSSKSLSKDGNNVGQYKFSLLSDVELLYLMKQQISLNSVSEYFLRNERKGPVWKSNEEFLFCLDSDEEKAIEVASFVKPLITHLNEIEDLSHKKQIDQSLYDEIESNKDFEGGEELIRILDVIRNYTTENGEKASFEYVILPAKNSFYTKINSKKLYIRFNNDDDGFTTYDKIVSNKQEDTKKTYEFFYLYSKDKINANHFLNYLYENAHKNIEVRI